MFLLAVAAVAATIVVGVLASAGTAGTTLSVAQLQELGALDVSFASVLDPPSPTTDAPPFNNVTPKQFDPARTNLVQAQWSGATGCPNAASVATYPATTSTGTYSDPACATSDPKDNHNDGLVLVKTGPTTNNAAALGELRGVKGLTAITELGYDIRKAGLGTRFGDQGSHCGAGAPRFDIVTADGTLFFVGCQSPPPTTEADGQAWIRLRWGGPAGTVMGFCVQPSSGSTAECPVNFALVPVTGTIKQMEIVFDEGTDTGPDFFGAAVLDNIDVNGKLVGTGATNSAP